IAVGEHVVVKLPALIFVDVSRFQSFQVEANRSDWCFQFVSDGVDERVVLFVSTNLTNEERRVDDETENDCTKEDYAENEQCHFAPVEDYPTDIQRDRQRHEGRAERDEKGDRFSTASYAHGPLLYGSRRGSTT